MPWQFNLPDAGYEAAWKFLMDSDYFYADYGPTTVERDDPQFLIADRCCVWSGQSWPYATAQTLKAMANLLQNYQQTAVTRDDYDRLLAIYAKTHRKEARPYIAEACNPDTGSWEGHDSHNHSEHYFHSSYIDLIITGLVGLRPRDDDTIEVMPLAPADWDYFALDGVAYHGHEVSIVWDKTGARYGKGLGLRIIVDGQPVAASDKLARLIAKLPPRDTSAEGSQPPPLYNFAVNNDGRDYPKITASFTGAKTSTAKLIDGNYWYHASPSNRWTTEGSTSADRLGRGRFRHSATIHEVALSCLMTAKVRPYAPERIAVERWNGTRWTEIPDAESKPARPAGHRANRLHFKPIETTKLRVVLTHQTHEDVKADSGRAGIACGLSELEVWGTSVVPISVPPK